MPLTVTEEFVERDHQNTVDSAHIHTTTSSFARRETPPSRLSPHPAEPVITQPSVSATHTIATTLNTTSITPVVCNSVFSLKQKANSLSTRSTQQSNCNFSNTTEPTTTLVELFANPTVIQKSCPQLATTSQLLSTVCLECSADKVVNRLQCENPHMQPNDSAQGVLLYDNVGQWLTTCPLEVTFPTTTRSPSGTGTIGPSGRLYTTRRATTSNAAFLSSATPSVKHIHGVAPEARLRRYASHNTPDPAFDFPPLYPEAIVSSLHPKAQSVSRHTSSFCESAISGPKTPETSGPHSISILHPQLNTENVADDRSRTTLLRTSSSPYYNLANPEVLLHVSRTRSFSQDVSANTTNSLVFGGIPNPTQSGNRHDYSMPASNHISTVRSASLRGHLPDIYPSLSNLTAVPPPPSHRCQSPARLVSSCLTRHSTSSGHFADEPNGLETIHLTHSGPTHVTCGTESPRLPLGENTRDDLFFRLHYATLDFGPPDSFDPAVDHDVVEPTGLVSSSQGISTNTSTGDLFATPVAASRLVAPNVYQCPVHTAYGTLISESVLSEQVTPFEAHIEDDVPRVGRENGFEFDAADLPTNYVAICQLQTLAMRAVLDATI